MTTRSGFRSVVVTVAVFATVTVVPGVAGAQGNPGSTQQSPRQKALQLDRDGATTEAPVTLKALIDSAPDPEARARAQGAMAQSYALDTDCDNTTEYEAMVIVYWMTREEADPQNAFYQQGERANEGTRVYLDAGDLDAAERWYRRGYELARGHNPQATFVRQFVGKKFRLCR